jgi:(1->4)-alpha-D-glucan 1-alpha-D-glucosylmutase
VADTNDAQGRPRHPLYATYRVQLNNQFTLNEARRIVPYLDRLGISHLYCSPTLMARPGSMHGYDVVDPTRINPEIGTLDDLRALAADLHERGMGILLDIVPNHMGIGPRNPYWEDVLTHGIHSRYAPWFDIDWLGADHKVVLPVLGDELDAIIARGELKIDIKEKTPRFCYSENSWPIDPATLSDELQVVKFDPTSVRDPNELLTGDEGRKRLRALVDAQHYRLVFWRRGPTEINYRRFFDVNELIALRQEDPAVFTATHELILSLVTEGILDGLRVDHVDGLLDPLGYLERLRGEVERRAPRDNAVAPFPIVVEKILSPGEKLRRDWPVQGTTGYEFLNDLEDLFVDSSGYQQIENSYRSMLGLTSGDFAEFAHAGKVRILDGPLEADVGRLTRLLEGVVGDGRDTSNLRRGIVEFVAALPVYRTYIDSRSASPSEEDMAVIDRAAEKAQASTGAPEVDVVRDVVIGRGNNASGKRDQRLVFVERLQQTSGPATAKGIEDTALYQYIPLASRNEVGGAPDRPLDDTVERFHRANTERACSWPSALICTNTHDTKRSADVRARLDALSERAADWLAHVERWRQLNARHKTMVKGKPAPDPNAEYLLYQTLIGIWPSAAPRQQGATLPDRSWLESARERIEQYMLKAVKEAKTDTSWTDPNEEYETALKNFIGALLSGTDGDAFLGDVAQFTSTIAIIGYWNALARVLLHLTSPGVPDTYQGDELWFFALVDPDNRRPVDYEKREQLLSTLTSPLHRLHPSDERLKLGVLHRLLEARRRSPGLFMAGAYLPLEVQGDHAKRLVAFARRTDSEYAIVIAPRLLAPLVSAESLATEWGSTQIVIPNELRGRRGRSVLGDEEFTLPENGLLRMAQIRVNVPLALLLSP